MLVATGVIISAAAGFFLLPHVSANKCDKSIAVLPFENLSDEKENAYFADGIQDDVLTNLSKIGDLKVISRTSVMPYRGKASNVREIGKALGVGAILEGSVRRIGNRVRVNVQLINADTDEHMWAEDYDRDLTDVFAIQTDLAQQIVRELQAKLSPMEKAQIERRPTENGEAYLAFMQGHEMFYRADKFRSNTEKAEQLLRKQRSSIQTSPVHLLHWHGCTNGVIGTSIQRPRERKKHEPQQWKRSVCSRTYPRPISRWVFITTIASVIIRERWTNSPSRG
jgi:TolB-like protein